MSTYLGALLERARKKTLTEEDIKLLEQLIGQSISQTGKYNVYSEQGIQSIGDRYGPSVEEIKAITQEMIKLAVSNSFASVRLSLQELDDVPLTTLSIESRLIDCVNSRVAALEELKRAGQLSESHYEEFNRVKGEIQNIAEIQEILERIAEDANHLLQKAVKTLTEKLRELDRSQDVSLYEAQSRICLQGQIALLEEFQAALGYGKAVAHWLEQEREQNLAERMRQHGLKMYPEITKNASAEALDLFYISIEQFLDRLGYCLIWGRTSSLENPVTPVAFDDQVYAGVFEFLKTLIPQWLPKDGKSQLNEYIDFLVKKLPDYNHPFADSFCSLLFIFN